MERVEYLVISANEFDEIVHKHYPFLKDYEYVQAEEAHNDVCYSYTVTQEDWDKYDIEEWKNIKQGKEDPWGATILLRRLCKDGFLPYGDILIDVCW